MRALASHQCGPGSNPGVDATCGLSLLLVVYFAPRGFSPGTPVFPSPQKPTFSNSNSTRNQVDELELLVDVLPPNHYYILLTHRAMTTFLGKSPLELFMNRKPRSRHSGLRVKSSKEDVFKDNLDLTTKQRLRNPRKLVPGFWTSQSRPLST